MFLTLSRLFLYLSLLSVVIVMTSIFFPFIGGKYAFFRICVELALACFLLWWAFQAKPQQLHGIRALARQPMVIAVTAFVFIFVLASLLAHDPISAFWSNYERGDGAFHMLHYYAFFVLLLLAFRTEQDWRRAFWVSVVAAGLMILYGVAAAASLDGFIGPYASTSSGFWGNLLGPVRFQGSLGNAAYVAPYLMFVIGYVLYLWLAARHKFSTIGKAGYAALLVLFALFFALSNTRGAFLGLFAAIVAYALYLAFARPKLRKAIVIVLFVAAVGGSILFSLRNTEFVKRLPGSRVFAIGLQERTVQTRLWTWGAAWKGFKERPLLGWGPENFTAVFDKHFDPRHFLPNEGSETWFDRAHSVFFDYLAETGILGLIAYLSMLAAAYFHILKSRLADAAHSHPKLAPAAVALLFALPIGYFVQGLALFDVLPIYLNLFLLLAFIAYRFPIHRVEFHHEKHTAN